jgi:DNA-binding transcriptional LysR family regulator
MELRHLRYFQESSPGVRVQLHDLSTQEMLRGLRDGKLHVALMIQASAKAMDELVFEELRRYAVCMAAHPAHPLARARKVGLEQIVNERLIACTLADYPEYHARLADLFAHLQRPLQIAEEHDGATSLIASVEAGRGIALVQQGFECLSGPRLKVRPLAPAPPPFVFGIGIVDSKAGNLPLVGKFIGAVKGANANA